VGVTGLGGLWVGVTGLGGLWALNFISGMKIVDATGLGGLWALKFSIRFKRFGR